MIPYDGEEMHERPEKDRCVNCDAEAEENGWCLACWAEIVPKVDPSIVVGDGTLPS